MSKKAAIDHNIIYGLYEPASRGGKLRYIGQSCWGVGRCKEHRKPSLRKTINHRNNWLNDLINNDETYTFKILEELGSFSDIEERKRALDNAEIKWICDEREAGTDLVNGTAGGGGSLGRIVSDETKALQAAERSAWHAENEPTEAMKKNSYRKKLHQIVNDIEHKHCNKCDQWHPLDAYGPSASSTDGYQHYCKECRNKERREKHPYIPVTAEERAASYAPDSPRVTKAKATNKKNPQKVTWNKSVTCYKNGNPVKTFNSLTEAVKNGYATAIPSLSNAIRTGGLNNGYTWKKA